VLYPGSFVDFAASFVFDNVVCVDNNRQAARFFADEAGVNQILDHHRLHPTRPIIPEYSLAAVINARSGRYAISERELDGYLIPKRPTTITPELLHTSGRGISYTGSPFAYLFRHQKTDPR
jgi:hypothetical protein